MKKIVLLILAIATVTSVVGCSKQDGTSASKEKHSISTSTSSSNDNVFTPFTLNDDSIYPSSFIINGTSLIFNNWEDNNKIAILDEPYPNVISNNNINNFFNYSATSMTLVNNTLYFGNTSSSSNLSSIDINDKTYTKLNNRHVHDITSLNNEKLFYLDIPDSNSNTRKLYSYDIKSKKDTLLSSDSIGKYIINNNFILYQNLSDGSKLYKMNIDGSKKEKVTDYSVNSFIAYSSQLFISNSDDNNNIYIVDPSTLESKRFAVISLTNLKAYNNTVYAINSSNYLCKLNITVDSPQIDTAVLSDSTINEYYPTEKGIFVEKGINVNNPYLITTNN